ncbi:MAG TPA: sialidase family protein, partial [Chloroflexia bacterium]|nr:sialidase family protein [Chloroflexia bacterium]
WFSALWSSADGGLHWQHSEPGGSEHKASLLIYPADARLAYLYSYTPPPDFTMPRIYAYHLTTDAGRTWGLSGPPWPLTEDFIGPFVNSFFLPSHNTPFNLLEREILEFDQSSKKGPGGNGQTIDLSDDGGRTFHELSTLEYDQGMDYLVQTSTSLLRYSDRAYAGDPLAQQLTRSTDGGRTWQVMPRPPLSGGRFDYLGSNTFLQVAPTAPANVFLCDRGALWYSPDAGTTWQPLPASSVVDVHLSPYLPLTVLDVRGTRLYALDLPAAARQLTAPVLPAQAPGSQYFPQTGHNLGNTFLPYWQAHGGLAQLGYPLTDELAQVAATDGRIYMTQYFERAVFERHPENASPYDVLLSLLGVDAYHQHYGAAGAPHQHVSTANPRTFPQTGHTLGGVFRAYWESHGGLAQQGYPISDEFTEVSALNGQPYTVQYFQRAVFEYHPENAGTPYAVLLSQLGTFQARQLGPAPPTPGP